jgi:hypothetical protein
MAKRVIDLANPGGWIARKTLFAFQNMLVWGKSVDKDYTQEFKKVGDKVIIRKRVQWDAIDGMETGGSIEGAIQPIDERNAVLTVNGNPIVPFEATDKDMALSLEEFYKRYVMEAAVKLANQTELIIARTALKFSNAVGTPGTTPSDFDAAAACAEVLDIMSVPRDGDRSLIINPRTNRKLASNLTDKLNPATDVEKARRKGLLGETAGFAVMMSQVVPSHKDGVQDGTGQVDGSDQTGATINLKGFTPGDVLSKDGIITFDGVNSVNRYTKEDTTSLMQFRVTATATADGSGDMVVTIDPPLEVTGPYQNVTGSPEDGAAVTVVTYGVGGPKLSQCNFAFHKNAIAIAPIKLEMPKGMDQAEVVTSEDGWTLRYTRFWDIVTAKWICRMEILFAVDVLEPTAGVRLMG